MWHKLTFKHKKALLLGLLFLGCCIAYQFSFNKTIEALKLNKQLTIQEQETQHLDATYPQVESKNKFYTNVIKLYGVNAYDRENRLWQSVSSIALAKDMKISFTPPPLVFNDTTTVPKQIFMYEFNFKGNYYNCVSLLDSLSKTRGIGIIANLKLSRPKENAANEPMLSLRLKLATLIK